MDRSNIRAPDACVYLLMVILLLAGSTSAGQWDRHGRRTYSQDTDTVLPDTIVNTSPGLQRVTVTDNSVYVSGSAGLGTIAFLNIGFGVIENKYILLLEIENGNKTASGEYPAKELNSKNFLFGRVFFTDPSVQLSGLLGLGFLQGKIDGRTFYSTITFPVMAEYCLLVSRYFSAGIGVKASFNRYTNDIGVMLRIKAGKIKN